jgi:glycosyltransferase involved in cell wall biosynthesis
MAFVTPALSFCPTLATVYDLSFIHFPDRFPRWQRLYLLSQTRRSCRQARRVITISESSRQDVHRYFGVPLARIDVVWPGVDDIFRPLPKAEVAAFRRRGGLPERFILHVGTLQPRKNIPILLEALARLQEPHLSLVLVGSKGWLFDEIFNRVEELGLQERVLFRGYVPDKELPLWYNAASLFVFPSLYEGFGMPIVEAMACGTPVIAANTSSIPEATGEAALLFAPQDVAGLAEQLMALLNNGDMAMALRKLGLRQAQQFSWPRAGQETAAIYRRVLREI